MPYPGLLNLEPLPLQQSTADPYLHRRCSNTVLSVSVSVGSLGPGAQGSVVPSESLFPESISQSRVSSGSSMVGLMVTSSKRAYAIPKSAARRASVPVADNC